jgi:hypothetical protein
VVRRWTKEHTIEDELRPGPIGEAGACDVVTAELVRDMPLQPIDHDGVTMGVSTPAERVCFDVFLHRDIVGPTTPSFLAFTTINSGVPYASAPERDRIPVPEELADMGWAHDAPLSSEVPRHAELLGWMFQQLRADPHEYRLWRVRMRYAPIPTCLYVDYPLRHLASRGDEYQV